MRVTATHPPSMISAKCRVWRSLGRGLRESSVKLLISVALFAWAVASRADHFHAGKQALAESVIDSGM